MSLRLGYGLPDTEAGNQTCRGPGLIRLKGRRWVGTDSTLIGNIYPLGL